ncbi:hypothetical protein Tco_0859259 [Tanacetum coccineum]|uniref:Uncharacterized protein n=1 Tax=Tanacetum coccineum TaxID=301880 RepID=A0ABQ5BEG5_9ASTR
MDEMDEMEEMCLMRQRKKKWMRWRRRMKVREFGGGVDVFDATEKEEMDEMEKENEEDQHSYDVHRDMRKVIAFQTWLSKFPIIMDQQLDLEDQLHDPNFTILVNCKINQMWHLLVDHLISLCKRQFKYNLVAMIKNFWDLPHIEIMSNEFVFDMRTNLTTVSEHASNTSWKNLRLV